MRCVALPLTGAQPGYVRGQAQRCPGRGQAMQRLAPEQALRMAVAVMAMPRVAGGARHCSARSARPSVASSLLPCVLGPLNASTARQGLPRSPG